MNFSKEGDIIEPGREPILAPGVRGVAFDTPKGIYIPLIIAEKPGNGDVGRFLDNGLPPGRRVVFPNVISHLVRDSLVARGFVTEVETNEEGSTLVFVRYPATPNWVRLELRDDGRRKYYGTRGVVGPAHGLNEPRYLRVRWPDGTCSYDKISMHQTSRLVVTFGHEEQFKYSLAKLDVFVRGVPVSVGLERVEVDLHGVGWDKDTPR